jgi:hypothetical protein
MYLLDFNDWKMDEKTLSFDTTGVKHGNGCTEAQR